MEGRNMPCGSWYGPTLISVIGCTTRKPCSRHQRKRSALRIGSRKPGPEKDEASAMSAFRSSVVSPTAWPKNPMPVAVAGEAARVLDHGGRTFSNRVAQFVGPVVPVNSSAELIRGIQIGLCGCAYGVVTIQRPKRFSLQQRQRLTNHEPQLRVERQRT